MDGWMDVWTEERMDGWVDHVTVTSATSAVTIAAPLAR